MHGCYAALKHAKRRRAEFRLQEKRQAKLIVGKAGGTAGKGSKTYKVALPSKWVAALNLTDYKTEISFDGEKIIISSRLNTDEFLKRKKALGHKLVKLDLYDKESLCTTIIADFIIKTAFGNNEVPTWEDFQDFLEERCVPRSRGGIREYLEAIGVEEYNPFEIIKKTNGRMAEDYQWIKTEEIK